MNAPLHELTRSVTAGCHCHRWCSRQRSVSSQEHVAPFCGPTRPRELALRSWSILNTPLSYGAFANRSSSLNSCGRSKNTWTRSQKPLPPHTPGVSWYCNSIDWPPLRLPFLVWAQIVHGKSTRAVSSPLIEDEDFLIHLRAGPLVSQLYCGTIMGGSRTHAS